MGVQVVYISGTNIPSISAKLGAAVQKAGISARLSNLKQMEVDLNVQLKKIRGGTIVGLLEAAAYLRQDMDKTPPLIPVDKGPLRASWFVSKGDSSSEKLVKIICGFGDASVDYAVYVHEMTSPPYGDVKWSRPGSGPKFFEAAINRNFNKILQIVEKNAEIQ